MANAKTIPVRTSETALKSISGSKITPVSESVNKYSNNISTAESWSEVQKLWDDAAVDSAKNAKKVRKAAEGVESSGENVQGINDAKDNVYSIRSQFYDDYDKWDGRNPRVKFNIGNTSRALKEVGVKQADIIIDAGKLIKIKNKHPEMTDEVIKKIPELLEHPYLIMESKSVAGRIVVYGDVISSKGPVMAALELNPTKNGVILDNIIKVASSYTKEKTQNLVNKSTILWVYGVKNKTNDWLKRTGLQLPVGINQYGLIKNITSAGDSVNKKLSMRDNDDYKSPEYHQEAMKRTAHMDPVNVYSYRNNMPEAEYGMKEEERYNILSKTNINVVDGNMQLTENEINNLEMGTNYKYENFFKLLGEKFGIYKEYTNGEIQFKYSKSTISESIHKVKKNPENNVEIVAMMANTKDIIENAVPIIIHDDKYKGTVREDKGLKNVYVMMGMFENKGSLYPVEIVVKNRVNGKNNLYMEVVLNAIDKIKGNEISSKAAEKNQRHSPTTFPYEVNITDVIRNVNSEDAKFLKYFPKKMLSKEQLVNVEEATEKENIKIEFLKDGGRVDDRDIAVEYKRRHRDDNYVNEESAPQEAASDIAASLEKKGYGIAPEEIETDTGDIRHSYRGDTRSDREILADALMGATKNTAERNELEDMYIIVRSLRMGKGNYRFIVGFNSALIALGLGGLISPSTSALVHNGSTILTGVKSTTSLLD